MICLAEEVLAVSPPPLECSPEPPTPAQVDEMRRMYLDDRLTWSTIAHRVHRTWQAVLEAVLPEARAGSSPQSPPICMTCDRGITGGVRNLLREWVRVRGGQPKPKERAVPVPDFCVYCARPKAEVRIELAKAQARCRGGYRAQ